MSFPGDTPSPLISDSALVPSDTNAPRPGHVRSGAALLALGVALIACAALIDAREAARAPWTKAVFSPEGAAPWDGAIPIRARRLSLDNYPLRQQFHRALMKRLSPNELRALGLERTDWLIVVYAPVSTLEPLLASGRMPRPGYPEVLAGAFADRAEIRANDGHFEVVGRLSRTAAGLATTYVMPADEIWEPLFERTMTWGWLDPGGLDKLAAAKSDSTLDDDTEVYGGMFPASLLSMWCSLAGLALAAAGGSVLHRAAFARVRAGLFAPACHAFGAHPAIVRVMHLSLYGGFFFAAVLALILPQINVFMINFIAHAFSEGNLGYVGDAYRSRSVPAAAVATWVNNYLVQTVALTVVASVFIPCIGVFKTLASFVVAGLGIAPVWSGTAANYTFHSITMVLELEAYIYTCVAVVIFWMKIVGAIRRSEPASAFEGARILASATVLAGVLLAIAGLYEATTLILLS